MAQTYRIPDDIPNPKYFPSEDRLSKPVSTLGYGIGGLLGPRFAKLARQRIPAPNAYQWDVFPPPVQRAVKAKRKKWNDFVHEYERIVQTQYEKFDEQERTKRLSVTRKTLQATAPSVAAIQAPPRKSLPSARKNDAQAKACQQQISAFGMCLTNPRLAPPRSGKLGVALYETDNRPTKTSHQITTPEGELVPRVRLVCHPAGHDNCRMCRRALVLSDYYQTQKKCKIVVTKDPEVNGPFTQKYLSLCRDCYCKALKFGCPPWTKDKIPTTFVKARHCGCVHDHQDGQTQFLMKSTCKLMEKLSRRELVYSKFFKDDPRKSRS